MTLPRRNRQLQSEEQADRRRLRVRPAYLILAALMVLFAFKFLQRTQEIRHLTAQESALQYQNAKTARENQSLRGAIKYYRTPVYIESEARTLLGYAKPGDVVIRVEPASKPRVAAPPTARLRLAPPPEPVWKQWWKAFFQ